MPRILYVEDDKASGDILARLLKHLKIEADIVQTAEGALEKISGTAYDLVVVDLALPGIDGWRLLQALRDDPQHHNLKVVALTAFHNASIAQQARQAGFLTCLPKPATLKTAEMLLSFAGG